MRDIFPGINNTQAENVNELGKKEEIKVLAGKFRHMNHLLPHSLLCVCVCVRARARVYVCVCVCVCTL